MVSENPVPAPSHSDVSLSSRLAHTVAAAFLDDAYQLLESTPGFSHFCHAAADGTEPVPVRQVLYPEINRHLEILQLMVSTTGQFQQQHNIHYQRNDGEAVVNMTLHPPDADGRWLVVLGDVVPKQQTKVLFSNAFQLDPVAILILSLPSVDVPERPVQCLAANHAAEKLFGFSSAYLEGKPFADLNIFPEHQHIENRFRYVAVTGKPELLEYIQPQATGDDRIYDTRIIRLPHALAIHFTDVTDIRQTEARLRTNYNQLVKTRQELRQLNTSLEVSIARRTQELTESEERFRLVANATNDAIYDWDLSSGTNWWSNGLYTQFGYPTEGSSQNRRFWEDNIHPDDFTRVRQALDTCIQTASAWRIEYRFRRVDGYYSWVLDRANVVCNSLGIPYRMLGSMLDISDIRAARRAAQRREAEYYHLADSLPHIIWTADERGRLTYLNKRWEAYTGHRLLQPSRIIELREYIHPEDLSFFVYTWRESIEQGRAFELECRLREAQTGLYRWFAVRALKSEFDDEHARWHGVCLDIHDRKTSNDLLELRVAERTAALETANRELEASNSELQQFASVTSHDLKEPLRKIQIFGKMVRDRAQEKGDVPYIGPLERIVNASERLTALINDLLSFSRLSAEVKPEVVNLDIIVREVLADLEILIQEKEARIHLSELPSLLAVPAQMRQLFQNLISNALKFSHPGVPPVIHITATRVAKKQIDSPESEKGRFIRLQIIDNGIGFNEAYLEKIFTLFQRLHSHAAYEGTGIGLAIVKKIVIRHEGIISASSSEGSGATFTIVLPDKS
ncbi:MAG: PAS domain S-box protein [Sphingobacteriales bacterium]|nr:MAG: PAS domain S-box protein [Sphingobacteriales bacterium]